MSTGTDVLSVKQQSINDVLKKYQYFQVDHTVS